MDRKKELRGTIEAAAFVAFVVFLAAFVLATCNGCSTLSASVPQTISQDKVYKYDLKGFVNGMPFDGVGVIPFSNNYLMRIESRVDVDLLTITSCHRDFSAESAIHLGWFESRRGYEYSFSPSSGIEDNGPCHVRLGAYNKDQGANAWGIIDFETPEAKFPALNICNGLTTYMNGVSICQSRVGLIQRLAFQSPVSIAKNVLDPQCIPKPNEDKTIWEYVMAKGECVIAFMEDSSEHRIHRHTTVGFTDILIRGE